MNKMDHNKMEHDKMDHSKMEHDKMDHSKHNGEHVDHSKHSSHQSHDHSAHIKDFKKRFIISAIITIPILILSETIQMWFKFEITIPYQRMILFTLATIIFLYGGWPFLKGMVDEIRKKLPGMRH